LLDEALLALVKRTTYPDITLTLQIHDSWYQVLSEDPPVGRDRMALLAPRCTQYIRELVRRQTFGMLSVKIAGHLLPLELTDMIRSILVATGTVTPGDEDSMAKVWEPFNQSLLPACEGQPLAWHRLYCRAPTNHHDRRFIDCQDIFRWPTSEYSYIHFHPVLATCVGVEAVWLSEVDTPGVLDIVYVRCNRPGVLRLDGPYKFETNLLS
jgi:hypothetical protein